MFPPASQWSLPQVLPSLQEHDYLALDLETKDPRLTTKGPGFSRSDGTVVGIAIATSTSQWYLPIRHFGGGNLDPSIVLKWLSNELKKYKGTVLFANAQYDIGWLIHEGIPLTYSFQDVQLIEALLDHTRLSYSLNALAKNYLGLEKQEHELKEAAKAFGVDPKKEMWKLHSKYVGCYAEQDARLTYDIFTKQEALISKQNIGEILDLENQVLPVILDMAMQGVRVDLKAAEILYEEYGEIIKTKCKQLRCTEKDVRQAGWVKHQFDTRGLDYPMTAPTESYPNGQPSFQKEFIRNHPHPDIRVIGDIREIARLRKVYIGDRILEGHTNGRVYPHYIQLSSDDGGAKTGRLAGKNYPMQQVPKRSRAVDAKRIRALHLPEEGEKWLSADYDSQEPRLQIHYGIASNLRGAAEAKVYVNEGKKLYHLIQDACGCEYDQAKTIYLGLSYGMGLSTLADNLNLSEDEAKAKVLDPIQEKCPFMIDFSERAEATANQRGYVYTIKKRFYRFDWWQSANHWTYKRRLEERTRDGNKDATFWWLKKASQPFRNLSDAEEFFSGKNEPLQRAFTQKAGNAIIQGSAADQTKVAMVEIYKAIGRAPLSQVHDEINMSISNENETKTIKEIMEHCIELNVPTVADCDVGDHW